MSTDFVFNLGYDTSHIISVLGSEGLESDSRVVILVPKKIDSRQNNSIKDLENHLRSLGKESSLEKCRLSGDLQEKIMRLTRLYRRLDDVVLSLSGGPRDHLIPMLVALIYSKDQIAKTVFRSDLSSELKQLNLPGSFHDLNSSESHVLEALGDRYRSVNSLEGEIPDISESTVRRSLESLVNQGLAETKTRNGKKNWKITTSGKIIQDQDC